MNNIVPQFAFCEWRDHLSHPTRAATRKGDGALLILTHGPDSPVSRANITAIREAGLLPRT